MGVKKGFNKYEIFGIWTIFYIINKQKEIFDVYIDTKNLQRLIDADLSWHLEWKDDIQSYYVHATKHLGKVDGKQKVEIISLHRFIMNVNGRVCVDHEDHNGLNNREYNLRISTYKDNLKHRESRNSNNTSGYRNVSLIHGFYRVQLQIDGKNTIFPEKFDNPSDAGIFAEEMRLKYYGEFSGGN